MSNFRLSELADQDLVFNNANRQDEDAFEIEVCDRRAELHGANFALWQNGQLIAAFASFVGLQRRADEIINQHNLERVA